MKRFINEEKGLTLLEVVVSMLIITLILISFYGLLIQSKKAGKSSEDTVESTYIAQQKMEYMYGKIRATKNLSALTNDPDIQTNYTFNPSCASTGECEFTDKNNSSILINIKNEVGSQNLVRVITTIDDQTADPVIMETIWRWE